MQLVKAATSALAKVRNLIYLMHQEVSSHQFWIARKGKCLFQILEMIEVI